MVSATGIGSMPGGDAAASEADNTRDYREAVAVVTGELPDLLPIPELPGRGAGADMVGRSLAMVTELGVDLQPSGWRLTDRSGIDHRRSRSLLAHDLDHVEEAAQGFTGTVKTQVCGPWTLAATVEKPRGEKVLADHGARRELGEALIEGLETHVSGLRRRFPDASRLIVQVDEPVLPAVLSGRIPNASGWRTLRSVDPQVVSGALESVLATVNASGAVSVVHCCARDFPIELVREAGAGGIAVDTELLDGGGLDQVATALEAGDLVLMGVLPTVGEPAGARLTTEKVLRILDLFGLEPTDNLVLTPACGLAGTTPARARATLTDLAAAARNLS